MVSRGGLMTIYFKSRASGGNICRESRKTTKAPNSSFLLYGYPTWFWQIFDSETPWPFDQYFKTFYPWPGSITSQLTEDNLKSKTSFALYEAHTRRSFIYFFTEMCIFASASSHEQHIAHMQTFDHLYSNYNLVIVVVTLRTEFRTTCIGQTCNR